MVRGVGVGLRHEMQQDIEGILHHVDFIEVNMGNVFQDLKLEIQQLAGKLPIVIHSVNLSLGSVEPPKQERLTALKKMADLYKSPWVSEHLSFSRFGNIEIETFIPLPYTEEAIDVVSSNMRNVQDFLNRPLLVENITHSFTLPQGQFTEAEFIKRVLEASDCGLLLDVTNLYLNSKMNGYDPYHYLQTLPSERIIQLHVAGHDEKNGKYVDSHVGGIHPDVLALTDWILNYTPCEAVLIERDSDLNGLEDLLPDLEVCRSLYSKYRHPVSHRGL